jgi:hypothetical protein
LLIERDRWLREIERLHREHEALSDRELGMKLNAGEIVSPAAKLLFPRSQDRASGDLDAAQPQSARVV